jgi:DNA-binding GntR family transcriptional regulator
MIPWSVSTPSTAPYSASGNARLLALVEVQHDVADRYVRILLASFDYRDRSQREHRDLLDAARGGRVEAAVAVLRRHLREGMETLVAALGAQR